MSILARAWRPALLVALAVPALAQDATVTPANTLAAPPTEWLGETPHLVLMGTMGGRPIDVQYLDIAQAEGIAAFSGKREYLPGDAGAWLYGDFEVALSAVIANVEKSFEIEIENRDFDAHSLPATFALGSVNFPEGAAAYLEAAAEWETDAGSVNDELGGWEGTLIIERDDGIPDDEGLRGDGVIGGHMDATRGEDHLVMSFTVPVTAYEKDE